jgi:hypothetical protein
LFPVEEKEGGVSQLVDELPHRMTRYCKGVPSNGFVDLVLLSFSLLIGTDTRETSIEYISLADSYNKVLYLQYNPSMILDSCENLGRDDSR